MTFPLTDNSTNQCIRVHETPQLPLSLLKTAQGHPMLVELKNGDTYNGRLVSCDTWMNITLRDVICTSRVRGFERRPNRAVRWSTVGGIIHSFPY